MSLLQYWDVFAFYTIVAFLLYFFRSKFEFQGIIALLRTTLGVKFMTRLGKRHPVFWHRLGLVSITLGFIGMTFITFYLFFGLYQLFFVPTAPPVLSPVIPGVKIPGVPITFPLWYTLVGLFLAVIVHESAHGIYSAAYNIKIKSSGFAFFGPLPGAFVEPDEKVVVKRPKRQQLAIMAAGPFSNVVLAIVVFFLALGVAGVSDNLVNFSGVEVGSIQNGSAAAAAGIPVGVITAIDAAPVTDTIALTKSFSGKKPGDSITLTIDGSDYTATLGENPTKSGEPFLGIVGLSTKTEPKIPAFGFLYSVLSIVLSALVWTYIISLGIGIANLIPIGPLDGGRMFFLFLLTRYPEERAKQVFTRWSFLLLGLVLFLVFVPIIKAII